MLKTKLQLKCGRYKTEKVYFQTTNLSTYILKIKFKDNR